MKLNQCFIAVVVASSISACGSSSGDGDSTPTAQTPPPSSTPVDDNGESVSSSELFVNQTGFLPMGSKVIIVPDVAAMTFEIIDSSNNEVVLQGDLTAASEWVVAPGQTYKAAVFTQVEQEGQYLLRIEGVEDKTFEIAQQAYSELHNAALKSYYFNRASQEITEAYGGQWARALGHADEAVAIHYSARIPQTENTLFITSAKGWYDAGDYGKYVVNSGIATYTLLAAFDHYPDFYQLRDLNIPESGDAVPDILDEIKWNLDWLQTMQAPDGSVYHKLTTLGWPGIEMPEQDLRARYVIGRSTSAALNFAAVMAKASRVYGNHSDGFSELSANWLQQAQDAWDWAIINPNTAYDQPLDVESGQYGDNFFQDEFSWAAAELFITTREQQYLDAFISHRAALSTPSWQYVSALASFSMLNAGEAVVGNPLYWDLRQELIDAADEIITQDQQSTFNVAMTESDFVWGSNSVALNKAMFLLQAYRLTQATQYKLAASNILSYILGQNPTGYSFVTGFGDNPVMFPHHRISAADGVNAPVPGMLVGGPQNGQQDGCSYSSNAPALSFLDDWCSYSTNEVAINWNAPLVYLIASLLAEE